MKNNCVYTVIGASNHCSQDREKDDFYATDPIAIDKLLSVETPSEYVFECCAGNGHLAKRLQEKGHRVLTNDLIERDFQLDSTIDFLQIKTTNSYGMDIITNPPYKYAKEFVLKALDLVKDGFCVYMFLKLTFLEGKARYKDLFSKYPPKKVYVFSERVTCAKNGDFESMKESGGSAIAYAWFVWEKGFCGDTIIKWI